jgi:hypothetical protein
MKRIEFPNCKNKRYYKAKYQIPEPQVGDVFTRKDPKPGCYNQLKVIGIDGESASVAWYSDHIVVSSPFAVELEWVKSCMDETKRKRWESDEKIRRIAYDIGRRIGVQHLASCNLKGNLKYKRVADEMIFALRTLQEECRQYEVPASYVPAGGFSGANSTTMRSVVSGVSVNLSFNDYHRVGYYGVGFPYLVQVRVGGGIDSNVHNAILMVAREILSSYNFTSELGSSCITDTDGTSWSSVAMTAPSRNNMYTKLDFEIVE